MKNQKKIRKGNHAANRGQKIINNKYEKPQKGGSVLL